MGCGNYRSPFFMYKNNKRGRMMFINMTEKVLVDKRLLNLTEFCNYLGIGQTKAREIMTKTNNPFTVRIGNRLYANKIILDKWIDSISGNKVNKLTLD